MKRKKVEEFNSEFNKCSVKTLTFIFVVKVMVQYILDNNNVPKFQPSKSRINVKVAYRLSAARMSLSSLQHSEVEVEAFKHLYPPGGTRS